MKRTIAVSTLAGLLSVTLLTAQTRITPPKNKYSPADDVKLGREAAAEARKQLPIMRDDQVTSYISDLGRKLVGAIPPELRQPEFRYTFETVNVREINAFALPGGPMFVNRGMIEAAKNEGEVVGVMAHELSHVVLRHGTAGASKQTPYAIGGIAGAIAGAIIGGNVGRVVSEASQFGAGALYLRFPREYEKQADLEGTQIMAAAGYDPRDMANMFKTIEEQGGAGGPEWMSDHPNPGNRYDYITKEAQTLKVSNPIRNTREFDDVRAHLRSMPKAPTTEEATKKGRSTTGTSREPDARPTGRVEAPSTRYTKYNEGNIFQISVPQNWREVASENSVTFAPNGAYGSYNGQNVFTHGVEVGVSRNESHDLQTATEELVDALRESNPRMSRPSGYRQGTVDGRRALQATVDNVSDATGQRETIQITTTSTRSGDLMYAITVAPRDEYSSYQPVFQKVLSSVRFID
jgi:Zn-dependent protease with chaperone function